MRLLKCRFCKQLIESNQIYKEYKKDRNGNIKIKKNGLPETLNSHIECFKKNEKNTTEWKALTNYLEQKYFVLTPKELCIQLKSISKKADYKKLLDCFKFMEENIMKNIKDKTFASDVVKGSYLFAVIKNNITTFSDKLKQKELDTMQELYQLNNDNTIFIDRSKYKSKKQEVIDYDIL